MEAICEISRALLQSLNQKEDLEIFFHEEEGCALEVQTDTKSPYLIFEADIVSKENNKYIGSIISIWLVQPEGECVEVFCGDLPKWHRGLRVEINLSSVLAESGTMKIVK
jgi:hypothetical protein